MKISDNLGTILPIGSTLLIFASAIKNSLVYAAFNIPILRYINITDLFLLILFDVILLAIGATFVSVFVIALEGNTTHPPQEQQMTPPPTQPVVAWFILFFSGLIVLQFWGKDLSYPWIGGILLGQFIISIFFFLYIRNRVQEKVRQVFNFFFVLFSIIILMGAMAFKEIHERKTREPSFTYTYVLDEEIITTSKNLIYIGKTLDYIFLYNKEKDMSRIIKTDELREARATPVDK